MTEKGERPGSFQHEQQEDGGSFHCNLKDQKKLLFEGERKQFRFGSSNLQVEIFLPPLSALTLSGRPGHERDRGGSHPGYWLNDIPIPKFTCCSPNFLHLRM